MKHALGTKVMTSGSPRERSGVQKMKPLLLIACLFGFSTYSFAQENTQQIDEGDGQNKSALEACIGDRRIHGCFVPRFFRPSARVYFDKGTDDPGEIDLYRDGSLNPTIDIASLYWPWRYSTKPYFQKMSWGPMLGVAISSPAEDSEDGMNEASSAPVVIGNLGLMFEYQFDGGSTAGFETGWAYGVSADESLSDNDDSAIYIGLTFDIPVGGE